MHKITHLCPENQRIDLSKEFCTSKLLYSTLLISKGFFYIFFSLYLISPAPSEDHDYEFFTISNVQVTAYGVYM